MWMGFLDAPITPAKAVSWLMGNLQRRLFPELKENRQCRRIEFSAGTFCRRIGIHNKFQSSCTIYVLQVK
jgi:hypothetical protein